MEDCVFCKIVKKEIPSNIIFENEDVIVFKTIAPVAEHHYLVCPKKHIASFMELDSEILSITKTAQEVIKKFEIVDGYKLIFNGGKYQEVMHVHWHLLAGKLEDEDDILKKT